MGNIWSTPNDGDENANSEQERKRRKLQDKLQPILDAIKRLLESGLPLAGTYKEMNSIHKNRIENHVELDHVPSYQSINGTEYSHMTYTCLPVVALPTSLHRVLDTTGNSKWSGDNRFVQTILIMDGKFYVAVNDAYMDHYMHACEIASSQRNYQTIYEFLKKAHEQHILVLLNMKLITSRQAEFLRSTICNHVSYEIVKRNIQLEENCRYDLEPQTILEDACESNSIWSKIFDILKSCLETFQSVGNGITNVVLGIVDGIEMFIWTALQTIKELLSFIYRNIDLILLCLHILWYYFFPGGEPPKPL